MVSVVPILTVVIYRINSKCFGSCLNAAYGRHFLLGVDFAGMAKIMSACQGAVHLVLANYWL
jgi:hypothetical protein